MNTRTQEATKENPQVNPTIRNIPNQKLQFEKKLAAYALAGAALAFPGVARAGIVDVPVNQTISAGNSYVINLSGAPDLTIGAESYIYQGDDYVTTGTGAQTLNSGTDPAALAFGALIDPTTSAGWGSGGKLVGDGILGSGGSFSASGGYNYLGFYFTALDGPHAGWALISTTLSPISFTLDQYAYEDTANTAITAGQGQTPEPASMALLALGGAGLLALRRRRSARA